MALKPISVKQLNKYTKQILQSDPILGHIAVVGEISGIKSYPSGHTYLDLKDDQAQINCVIFSNYMENIHFELENGMQVIAIGAINIVEKTGRLSFNIREVTVEGAGNLAIAYEKLKKKLEEEGLFDQEHKKPIPSFPEKIAVVTSGVGAAIQDIRKTIQNKNNYTDILEYHTAVQGEGAALEIATAIDNINKIYPEIDCIIVGRGGGSMEDLWAFNEEVLARSIYNSEIPIISAVGHETDVTISDFVADVRAETPTAAAVMAVPDINELKYYVDDLGQVMTNNLNSKIEKMELRLENNRMDAMTNQLVHRIEQSKSDIFLRASNMTIEMNEIINNNENKYRNYLNELGSQINKVISTKEHSYEKYAKELEALNPKSIMNRGYAAFSDKNGKLISSVSQIREGDTVKATLLDGSATMNVDKVKREEN